MEKVQQLKTFQLLTCGTDCNMSKPIMSVFRRAIETGVLQGSVFGPLLFFFL